MTAPYGVASDAVLWVKADSFVTTGSSGILVGAVGMGVSSSSPGDGARIDVWPDQSGNGNDMSQVFNTRRPEFDSTGCNGYPSVHFDSNRNCLLTTAAPVTTVTDNWTMVFVCDPDVPDSTTVDSSGLIPFSNGQDGSGYGPAFNITPVGIGSGYKGIHVGARAYSADPADSDPHIWVVRRVSGTASLYVDGGSALVTTTTTPSTPATCTRMGSQQETFAAGFLNGYVGEAIIWDEALSDSDLNTVGNALESKWGITWSDV